MSSDEPRGPVSSEQGTLTEQDAQRLSEDRINEPGAIEIQRLTETVTHKRVSEVVRVQRPDIAISIDKLRDPAVAQAVLDERNYWREVSADKEDAIRQMKIVEQNLRTANSALDKRCALAENNLKHAGQNNLLEASLLALGGLLCGAALGKDVPDLVGYIGGGMMAIAVISAVLRHLFFSPKDR
jgi:hypothetical protein